MEEGIVPTVRRPKIRRSRNGRRRAWVLVGVHLLLLAHVLHWWIAGESLSPLEPSEAMEYSKHGIINAGLVLFAAAILATALFGRFFCGWGCHLLALQDGCRWLMLKAGIRPRPLRSRALALVPLLAFGYMFLYPLALRLARVGRGADEWSTTYELTTSGFWATFPAWPVAVVTFLVCGFAAVWFLGSKGFCTYACPYGAIFGVAEQLSPGRIRVTDACEGCGHCTAVCSSNVEVHKEVASYRMVVNAGCMKCMDCVSVCPNDALYFGYGRPAVAAPTPVKRASPRRREYSWREEIGLASVFAASFLALRGLYGVIPFLLALGLAGVVAYLAVHLARLLSRPHLRLHHAQLKRAGKLQPAGYGFACATLGVLALCGHSAWMRYHAFHCDRLSHPDGDRAQWAAALAHGEMVQRWALLEDLPNRIAMARARRLLGETAAYERHIREVLDAKPEHALLRLELAEFYRLQGRPGEALREYRAAIEHAPAVRLERSLLARAHDGSGLVQAELGDLRSAVSHFRDAVALAPRDLVSRKNLAATLCALGEYREGAEEYGRAMLLDSHDPELEKLRAQALGALSE